MEREKAVKLLRADVGIETRWLIERKQYRADRPVGIEIANGPYGVKSRLQVPNAILATSSHFTEGVKSPLDEV